MSTATKRTTVKKQTSQVRLRVEGLEDRVHLNAAPVVFATYAEGSRDLVNGPGVAGRNGQQSLMVQTSPIMESHVAGRLKTGKDADVVKVRLKSGQFLTADVEFTAYGNRLADAAPKISVFNAARQKVAEGGRDGVGYRVPATGDYFVGVSAVGAAKVDPATFGADYTLRLRPIGFAGNDLDPKWLQRDEGGIYLWKSGNRLNISGPTGHGFSIRGNWSQSTSPTKDGRISSTYRADDTVYIQTSDPNVEIPFQSAAATGLSFTTYASKLGQWYGEMKTTAFAATTDFIESIASKFDASYLYGLSLDAAINDELIKEGLSDALPTLGEIGLKLGNDPTLRATGAPLNRSVPYLFINGTAAVYNLATIVVDPADPFVYFGSDYYGFAVGLSHNGLIPFTPVKPPSQFGGQLFGHVYVSGEFDLSQVTGMPFTVSGEAVLNLNGHGTGAVNPATASAISNAASSSDDPPMPAGDEAPNGTSQDDSPSVWDDPNFLKNFSVGVNGSLNVKVPVQQMFDDALTNRVGTTWFQNHQRTSNAAEYIWNYLPEDLSLSLASATFIYDGPNIGLYSRAGTNNNWQLKALPMNAVAVDLDMAYVGGDKLFLDVQGEYASIGLAAHGRVTLAQNFPLTADLASMVTGQPSPGGKPITGGYLEVGARIMGASVTLKGRVRSNGTVELIGSAGVNIPGMASASINVCLRQNLDGSRTLTTDLTGRVNIADTIRAEVNVHYEHRESAIGVVYFAGSGTAKIQTKSPRVSTSGVSWVWTTVASASIAVSSDDFSFNALGRNVRIALPD